MNCIVSLLYLLPYLATPTCEDCINTITVKGEVLEYGTEAPIRGVNVYIAGSQNGTTTDPDGNFILEDIEQETFQLIFSHVGYDIRSVNFVGANTDKTLKVYLKSVTVSLESVTVNAKASRKWERDLKKFKQFFFGEGYQRANIAMNNDYLLEFGQQKGKGFHVVNQPALEISNEDLGYDIYFQLLKFELGKTKTYLGHSLFKERTPENESQQLAWKANRQIAYNGSIRHFLKSLIDQAPDNEGFSLLLRKANVRDEIYSGRIAKPEPPRFADDGIYKQNIVVTPINDKVFELSFEGLMLVEFLREKDENGKTQKSQIELTEPLRIHKNGVLLNPDALRLNGYWTTEGMAQSLPFEYNPEKE